MLNATCPTDPEYWTKVCVNLFVCVCVCVCVCSQDTGQGAPVGNVPAVAGLVLGRGRDMFKLLRHHAKHNRQQVHTQTHAHTDTHTHAHRHTHTYTHTHSIRLVARSTGAVSSCGHTSDLPWGSAGLLMLPTGMIWSVLPCCILSADRQRTRPCRSPKSGLDQPEVRTGRDKGTGSVCVCACVCVCRWRRYFQRAQSSQSLRCGQRYARCLRRGRASRRPRAASCAR